MKKWVPLCVCVVAAVVMSVRHRSTTVGRAATLFVHGTMSPARMVSDAGQPYEAAIGDFDTWIGRWRSGPVRDALLLEEGRRIATLRRAAFKQLIVTDPRRALELAVSAELRHELPAEIGALLEQRVDGRGDLDVFTDCADDEAKISRFVQLNGTQYRAHVYGRRLEQPSKHGLPIHGVAIDDEFAFTEAPLRIVEPVEAVAAGIAGTMPTVMVGETVEEVPAHVNLAVFSQRLVAAESAAGPAVRWLGINDSSGGSEFESAGLAATTPAGWTTGVKRVLFMRIDFPDAATAGMSEAALLDALRAASNYFQTVSQGRTSFTGVVLPAVLRVSGTKANLSANPNNVYQLANEVLPLARAYDQAHGGTGASNPDAYDRWVIVYDNVDYVTAGSANIGASGIYIDSTTNGVAFPNTLAHELGHNFGLYHSHAWRPTAASPIGSGANDEYGDRYDLMGSGSYPMTHLSASQKAAMGYLEASAISHITAPGVYRLNCHDHVNAAGVRALVIDAGEFDFWIERRQEVVSIGTIEELNTRFKRGVFIHWDKHPNSIAGTYVPSGPFLLDMTPGSIYDFSDAALQIGETFTNNGAGFSISPIAVGGSGAGDYMDVRIDFITPTNPPAITANLANRFAGVGTTVTLTATVTGNPTPTLRWQQNGADLTTATAASLTLNNLQPSNAGIYRLIATNSLGTSATGNVVLGVVTPNKSAGFASEVGPNIVHPNGNVYDQFLLQGAAAAVTPDAGQVARISYIDLNDDIVQVEMSGNGTVAVVLDAASGPIAPVNYNQDVRYMKGHAAVIVSGADETTNLSIFTVGRMTAVTPSLFRAEAKYDGVADLAFVAILSTNTRFGGLRTANVNYFATRGFTGVYAPDVRFDGPVYIHDIDARDAAAPVFILGRSVDTRVTGGDLRQTNGSPIAVWGFGRLSFTAGTDSHGNVLPAQRNQGRLELNGTDITSEVVVNPAP